MNPANLKIRPLFKGLLTLLSAAVLLTACKKDRDGGDPFTIKGKLLGSAGNPIANALIRIGDLTTYTSSDGTYTFSGISNQPDYKMEISSGNYFTTYKNVENIDGSSLAADITMIEKTVIGSIPASGGMAYGSGCRIIAESNAFLTESGAPFSGTATVAARYVSMDDPSLAALMPGGDFVAVNASGEEGGLTSFGFIVTEFTDDFGNLLTPAAGKVLAGIQVPPSAGDPIALGARVWSFDIQNRRWIDAGPANMQGSECFMPVTHTYTNLDAFAGTGWIEGEVVCPSGNPVAYADITAKNKYNTYITKTNKNGRYRIKASAYGNYPYTITSENKTVTSVYVTKDVTTTVIDIVVDQCDDGNNNNPGLGEGSFSFRGSSYTGITACGTAQGHTQSAIVANNGTNTCIVVNPPTSGSVSVDQQYYEGCSTCPGIQVTLGGGTDLYISVSGTASISGNTLSFNAQMIKAEDIVNPGAPTYSLSGSLKCQ